MPALVEDPIRVGQVFEIDIYGARPVFGSLNRLEIDIAPGVQFDAFDRSIEMLQFNSALVFVDGDDFEQVAVETAIPAANFRDGYPMIFRSSDTREKKRRKKLRANFFINDLR